MKKIFVIFISLGFLQCANTPKVTSELLNGNWFYCNDDGYNEIYINKNNLIWSNEDFPSGVIYNYEIKGDSLITTTLAGEKSSSYIMIVDENELFIKYNGTSSAFNAYRIKDSIITPFDFEIKNPYPDKPHYLEHQFHEEFEVRMRNCN